MGKFSLIKFEAEHAISISEPRENIIIGIDMLKDIAKIYEINGSGMTLMVDDKIICCGGVNINKDVGEVWGIFSYDAAKYAKTVFKVAGKILRGIMVQCGLKYIIAHVDSKDVTAQAFIHSLDFLYQPSIPKIKGPDGKGYLTYRRAA